MQRKFPYLTSYTFSLMLSSHLRLVIPSGIFFPGCTTKILHSFLIGPTRATCRAHLKPICLIILTVSGVEYSSLSFFPFLASKYSFQHPVINPPPQGAVSIDHSNERVELLKSGRFLGGAVTANCRCQ